MGFDPEEQVKGGPRTKRAKVAASAECVERVHRFGPAAGEVNVMKGCDLSVKCAVSGIRCCGRFSDISGRLHFPPKEGAVL